VEGEEMLPIVENGEPGRHPVIHADFRKILNTLYSWEEILRKLGYSDRMVILKKPFDNIEVLQSAVSMTEKMATEPTGQASPA
jgi:hypothetical protein